MRKYEAVIIFNTDEGNFEKGKEIVKTQFEELGINLTKEEDMGERKLAYLIKKHDRGHYYLYEFESAPEKIKQFEKSLKLKNEVLKMLIVKKGK